MRKSFFILVVCSLTALITVCYAETVKLKNGRTIEGKIIEKTSEYIKISFQGVPLTYYYSDIASIDGKPVGKDITTYEGMTKAAQDSSASRGEKDATQLFKELADAVVYIHSGQSQGSGFIIDSEGAVVTNWHVIGVSGDITVTFKNGKTYKPTAVINYDILKDICVLQLDVSEKLPFIPLGDFNAIEIGQKAYVIGNPMGLKYLISDGIVSQKEEDIYGKIVQFTCPISPGNSGGPLLNAPGEAIGIVTSSMVSADPMLSPQNLNLAVSIDDFKTLLTEDKQLPLSEYTKATQGHSILQEGFILQAGGEPTKAFDLYKRVFSKTCMDKEIKNDECLFLFGRMLGVSFKQVAYWGVLYFEQFQLILKAEMDSRTGLKKTIPDSEFKKADEYLDRMLDWCELNINLIENAGGLKAVYELLTSYRLFPAKDWNKLKEGLSLGYYDMAAAATHDPNGRKTFYYSAQKVREAFPESQTVRMLIDGENIGEVIWKK